MIKFNNKLYTEEEWEHEQIYGDMLDTYIVTVEFEQEGSTEETVRAALDIDFPDAEILDISDKTAKFRLSDTVLTEIEISMFYMLCEPVKIGDYTCKSEFGVQEV